MRKLSASVGPGSRRRRAAGIAELAKHTKRWPCTVGLAALGSRDGGPSTAPCTPRRPWRLGWLSAAFSVAVPPDGPPDTEPQARRLTLTVDLTSEASCSRRGVLRQTVQATRVEALHAAKSFHDVQ